MVLNNLKKICFLRGEKVEIIRESSNSYLVTIDKRNILTKKK